MDNNPIKISKKEWIELAKIGEIRKYFELPNECDETAGEWLANDVYGVKFNFTNGYPGYVGDLFLLQTTFLGHLAPIMVGRSYKNDELVIFHEYGDDYEPPK